MLSEMKWARFATAVLVALALLTASALAKKPPKDPPPEPDPPPVTYTITWLDAFPESYVRAINSQGHVVGTAYSPDLYGGDGFAFLYTPETGMIDLNTLLPEGSGWLLKVAMGINDQGQIAGMGELNGDQTARAFRYTPAVQAEDGTVLLPAVVEEIGRLYLDDPNNPHNAATGINDLGEVCGRVRYDGPLDTRIAWYYNDVAGIEPLLGGMNLFPITINNASQILGNVEDLDNGRLFRVVPGDIPEFFHSPAGEEFTIWGRDMNDNGWFVGKTALDVTRRGKKVRPRFGAYRHDGVGFFDLGAGEESDACGINNHGDVVGVGDGWSGFVYLEGLGSLVNLDEAVTGDIDDLIAWFDADTSIEPQRINDSGQIAGHAFLGLVGTRQAFLLTPVPEGN